MKLEVAKSWFDERFPQDQLRAFILAGSVNADTDGSSSSKALYDISYHGGLRGLDEERRLVRLQRSAGFFLTDDKLVISSVGGAFRVRPKELRHTIERADMRCEWFDYASAGTEFRNFVFFMADGSWIGVGTGIKILGKETQMRGWADEFVAALGASATEIDWRNPPPV